MESTALLLIFSVIIIPLVVWGAIAYSKRMFQRVEVAWRQAAQQVGGRFVPPSGPWYNRKAMQVQAVVDGADVLLDHYTVSTGKSSVTYTRLRTPSLGPSDLMIKVYREHAFSTLGKALGFQDLEIGDATFDERFIIKASDEDLARLWLQGELLDLVATADMYGLTLAKGEVTTIRVGLEDSAERLEAVIRATAQLATRPRPLLSAWKETAEALQGEVLASGDVWKPGGAVSMTVPFRNVPVTVTTTQRHEAGMIRDRTETATVVVGKRIAGAREGAGSEPFSLSRADAADTGANFGEVELEDQRFSETYRVRSADPGATAKRLTEELRGRVAALNPARIEADLKEVRLLLPGVITEATLLRSAVSLVGELCAGPDTGPYR